MSYDLQGAVTYLTDATESIYLRAIKLFEFEAYVFCPQVETRWRRARLFAAVKMLELMERDVRQQCRSISIRSLTARDDYTKIWDQVVIPSGGLYRLRHLPKAKDFDDDLSARIGESKVVAKCVDFSYRYTPPAARKRVRAGITMARKVVREAPSFKVKLHRSTLKTRWNEYGSTAGFLFLIHKLHFKFKPPRVSTTRFAHRLVDAANGLNEIAEFFRAYSAITEQLKNRGYSLPAIQIDGKANNSRLTRPPLNPDALDAARKFNSTKDASG